MKKELTELSIDIARGLRDSFREEARKKIPLLLAWHDNQNATSSRLAQRLILDAARQKARFEQVIAHMPDASAPVEQFIKDFTHAVADFPVIDRYSPFTYPQVFDWLLAGGVEAGLARYPYYVEYEPEIISQLNRRTFFSENVDPRVSTLLVGTPIELGYYVGRGLLPEWLDK
ncbi:MAG: hypothetical protein UZ21_OP11001000724 [Microgenomates bacterium OLB22]|nr:MAG: hypothetical protein UZ21_OP11001000724 [Microgenomates bacterium OLB22]